MSTELKTKKVQANVDAELKRDAENVIKEVGLTPSLVINSLYKEIVATGRIPLSFSLTDRQKADLDLLRVSKALPVRTLGSKKEIEDFFNEDD